MANYENLTSKQEQYILQQRPDVAQNKYYSQNLPEWYGRYGKGEGFNFSGMDAYNANNISGAVASPTSRPNLSDPYGLYDTYMNNPELQTAKTSVTNLTNQLAGFDTQTEQNLNQIKNQPLSMNVIRGEQNTLAETNALQRAGIARELQAKQSYLDTLMGMAKDKYAIAQGERANLQTLIAKTGGNAGISYTDTYEEALKKATKWQEKEDIKNQAKSLGINTKGLSSKEISNKISNYNKKQKETITSSGKSVSSRSSGSKGGRKASSSNSRDNEIYVDEAGHYFKKGTGGQWVHTSKMEAEKEARKQAGLKKINSR